MKEEVKTLVEFLDENKGIGPLTVFGIYPLKDVTVSLQDGNVSYTMYISERDSAATYLFEQINKLPQEYKDRITFKPLNLRMIREEKIKDEIAALRYIDDFIKKRMNERAQR